MSKSTSLLIAVATTCLASIAVAGPRSSASYFAQTDSMDAGGRRVSSASYSNDGCIGGIAGVGTVAAPAEVARHGYVGQLYEIARLVVSASTTNVNEGATRQLAARAILDDTTSLNLAGSSVAWSPVSGPILSISAGGLATAANVYQHTPATVQGSWRGKTGTLGLRVINVGTDDFGTYAGDGIDDAWQVQFFGVGNPAGGPNNDPDGDGQTTGYEFFAGSIPTDANSFFRFRIDRVPGQPTRKNLVFSPRVAGRTYTAQYKLDLNAPGWNDLTGFTSLDAGQQRTITDLNATEMNKFYQVRITMP